MIKEIKVIPYVGLFHIKRNLPNLRFISITCPDFENQFFKEETDKVLPLKFWDFDPSLPQQLFERRTKEYLENLGPMFNEELAKKIINKLYQWASESEDCTLIINCMMGISRSGAVGDFARKFYELDYNFFKRLNPQIVPNRYVFNLLLGEWRKFNFRNNLNND